MTTEDSTEKPESPDHKSEGSGFSVFRHHYYHREDKTDISAMRSEAYRRLIDKQFPETSVIHHHDAKVKCEGHKHEVFDHEEDANA